MTSRAKVRLITAAIAILVSITPAWSQKPGGKRGVDVATVNLYVGADFAPITTLNPADPDYFVKLVTSVATIHAYVVASNFPERAAALAQEIVARSPDIVALQEVSLIRRQSPGRFDRRELFQRLQSNWIICRFCLPLCTDMVAITPSFRRFRTRMWNCRWRQAHSHSMMCGLLTVTSSLRGPICLQDNCERQIRSAPIFR